MKIILIISILFTPLFALSQTTTVTYYTDNPIQKPTYIAQSEPTPITVPKPKIKVDTKKQKSSKLQNEAWRLYNQKDYTRALQLFRESYKTKPDQKTAQGIIYSLLNSGQTAQAYEIRQTMPLDKKTLGDIIFQYGWAAYIAKDYGAAQTAAKQYLELYPDNLKAKELQVLSTAALTAADTQTSSAQPQSLPAASPRNAFGLFNRFNKITGTGLAETLNLTTEAGLKIGNFNISVSGTRLSSGNPADTQSGSYYKGIQDGQTQKYPQKVYGFTEFMAGYNTNKYGVSVGLGPVGVDISPTPVASAYIKAGGFLLNAQSLPVTQTTLSYIGLKDPFTGDYWGRVNKSGASLSFKPAWQDYFMDASLGAYYLWGKNVKDNTSVEASLSAGKSYSVAQDFNLTLGLFITGKMYQYDLNHFTYGHGGYYSPQKFIVGGPFAAFNYSPWQTLLTKAEVSIPLIFSQTKDSQKYYGAQSAGINNAQALADLESKYTGSIERKIGFNIKLSANKDFAHNWQLYGAVGANTSATYNEYEAILNLIKRF